MIPKTIAERLYNTDDAWHFEQVVKVKRQTSIRDVITHTLQVSIRYSRWKQSHVKVHRWDGNEWKLVFSVPNIDDCECQKAAYTLKGITKKTFENDAFRLVNEAIAIVCD